MPCKLWGAETTSLGLEHPHLRVRTQRCRHSPTPDAPLAAPAGSGLIFHTHIVVFFFFFSFPPFLSFKTRSQKLHSNPRLPGSDSSAVIALSLRLRLYPCRCEELQLSIQLACLCGGTGFAVEEGSLGARAVTNRSDTARLWHQGRAGRGFSSTVQLPLHSLFGRCAAPRRAAGLPGGSWNQPKHLPGAAGAAASSSRDRLLPFFFLFFFFREKLDLGGLGMLVCTGMPRVAPGSPCHGAAFGVSTLDLSLRPLGEHP